MYVDSYVVSNLLMHVLWTLPSFTVGLMRVFPVNKNHPSCSGMFYRASDRHSNAIKPPAAVSVSKKSPAISRSRPDVRGATQPQKPATRSHMMPGTRMHRWEKVFVLKMPLKLSVTGAAYRIWNCSAPRFICWFWCYINRLLTYILTYLLSSFLMYFHKNTPVPFSGQRSQEATKPGFGF